MRILALKHHDLKNNEHFEFFTDFIELANSVGVEKLKIEKPFGALTLLFKEEDEALKKILKSDLTRQIHDTDEVRDEVFRGMLEANRSALKHFKPAIREAATRLGIVFDTYGNVAGMALSEETSAVQNLLDELTLRHTADMSTVGLTEWAKELRERNLEVRKLMAERDDETSERSTVVLREMRLRVDEIYRKIIDRLEVFATIDEEESEDDDFSEIPPGELKIKAVKATSPYAPFIVRLNALIERFNIAIAKRKGKAAKKSESGSGLKD
ncbi:MAG: DUF6261 family protein [Tannerellaceae bacterium]|jgi:hypothetical protein|nr:DUF6261 family protein [Tannerellaceae bacterium]